MAWGAIIQAAGHAGAGILGYFQSGRTKDRIRSFYDEQEQMIKDAPKFRTPSEIDDIVRLSQDREFLDVLKKGTEQRTVSTRLPGQDRLEEGIRRSSGAAYRRAQDAASDSGSLLGSLTQVHKGELEAFEDLGIRQQQYADQKMREEEARIDRARQAYAQAGFQQQQFQAQALGQAAEFDQQEFLYNEYQPYQQRLQLNQARFQALEGIRQQQNQQFIQAWGLSEGSLSAFGGAMGSYAGRSAGGGYGGRTASAGSAQSSSASSGSSMKHGMGGSYGYKGV